MAETLNLQDRAEKIGITEGSGPIEPIKPESKADLFFSIAEEILDITRIPEGEQFTEADLAKLHAMQRSKKTIDGELDPVSGKPLVITYNKLETFFNLIPQMTQKSFMTKHGLGPDYTKVPADGDEKAIKKAIEEAEKEAKTAQNNFKQSFEAIGHQLVDLGVVDIRTRVGDVRTREDVAAYMEQQREMIGMSDEERERIMRGHESAGYNLMQSAEAFKTIRRIKERFSSVDSHGRRIFDAVAFIAHALPNSIINSSTRIEGGDLYTVRNAGILCHLSDWDRAIIDGSGALMKASDAMASTNNLESVYNAIQHTIEPRFFQEVLRWSSPVEIKLEDGTKLSGTIGPADFFYELEENNLIPTNNGDQPVTAVWMSKNYNKMEEAGEGGLFDLVLKRKLGYISDPNNPIKSMNLWIDEPVDLRTGEVADYPLSTEGELKSWMVSIYALSLPFVNLTGRVFKYDPLFLGKIFYELRKALGQDNYSKNYDRLGLQSRVENAWYGDFFSERANDLVPIYSMQKGENFESVTSGLRESDGRQGLLKLHPDHRLVNLAYGLEDDVEDDDWPEVKRKEEISRIKEYLDWIFKDAPLPAYMKTFEQAIINGESITIDAIAYPEFKGLDEETLESLGFSERVIRHKKDKKAENVYDNEYSKAERELITLDFSENEDLESDAFEFARHFVIRNRIPAKTLRSADEIVKIWEGLSGREKDIFREIPFLSAMVAMEPDIFKGSAGVERIIDSLRILSADRDNEINEIIEHTNFEEIMTNLGVDLTQGRSGFRGIERIIREWDNLTPEEREEKYQDTDVLELIKVFKNKNIDLEHCGWGIESLDWIVRNHHPRHFTFECMKPSDFGKWLKYLKDQPQNHSLVEACHLGMNQAPRQDKLYGEGLARDGQTSFAYVDKQIDEVVTAYQAIVTEGHKPVRLEYKALIWEETLVVDIHNNLPFYGRPMVRFKSDVVGDAWKLENMRTKDYNRYEEIDPEKYEDKEDEDKGEGFIRREVDLDLLQKGLGVRVDRINGEENLIGFGNHAVCLAEVQENSAPMKVQSAGRRIHERILYDITTYSIDAMAIALGERKKLNKKDRETDEALARAGRRIQSVADRTIAWLNNLGSYNIVIRGADLSEKERDMEEEQRLSPRK